MISQKRTDYSRDFAIGDLAQSYMQRIASIPPGTCPLAVHLALLKAGEVQTCGKCVPCRDGIPQMSRLLQKIVDGDATRADYDQLKRLAQAAQALSDCSIGYEAGRLVLEGMNEFADEYESHLTEHKCVEGVAQKVPCEAFCPAHVNVPGYISLTLEGDYAGAINMVRKDNPFVTACALVCEHPCEIRCRRTLLDAPINIRGIKKYAVDQIPVDQVAPPRRLPQTGKKIAVIGSGPSGMTCAYFAALMGHDVEVFEARKQLGGMLRYGIPAYRFPRERLDEDIRGILRVSGITVHTETPVDAARMQTLVSDFDAVYVAIGAQTGKTLNLSGIESTGVFSAVDVLERIGDGDCPDYSGKHVAVIGGGNVAMDAARTALRLGAEDVSIVYRRRKEDMTALEAEVEAAIAEGIELITLMAPASIEANEDGHCVALMGQPQMIGPEKHGRPAPLPTTRPEVRIPADIILVAVGQDIVSAPFEEIGMQATRGRLHADEYLRAPGFDNVFVGGDAQEGPATVIKAIGEGKVAARAIDSYLGYAHTLDPEVVAPPAHSNNRQKTGRVEVPERPARERKHDFDGVELEISYEEMIQEATRCLRCDHFGCGVLQDGRLQYV